MDPEEATPERSRAPDQPAPGGPAATDGAARASGASSGGQEPERSAGPETAPERHPGPDLERDGQPAARPEADPPGGSGRVTVPPSLARAAAVSWRLLVVVAAAAVVLYLLVILRVVVIPVIVALFAASLLVPAANRLRRAGWPPLAATWAVFGSFLIIVVGIFVIFVPVIATQFEQIRSQAAEGVNEIRGYLARFGVDNDDLQRYFEQARRQFSSGGGGLTSGVISGARLVGEVIAGIIVALVMLFFFVKDSGTISRWLLELIAPRYRADARAMGHRASTAISGYIRGVAIVGFVDGFFIGLGLLLLGVPLAIPLAFLTFVGAFLPLVGAFVAGLLAALVALVSKGLLAALAVVAITIAVQQLEGHILAPLVLGRAVKLHPIVILLALGAGSILGGIAGAFLAVPVAATLAALAGYMRERNAGVAPAAAARIDGDGGAREPPT